MMIKYNPFEDLGQKLNLIFEKLDQLNEQTVESMNRKDVLTLKEVEDYTSLKESTILKHKRNGTLPHFKQAGRVYFQLADIITWLTKNQIDSITLDQYKEKTIAAREKRRQNMYKNFNK